MTDAVLSVITIGGYLGSGKTTLLNNLLRRADGRRLAVLVNEFGELPIDEDLIVAEDENMISIAGGCICCSFGNDLIGALNERVDAVYLHIDLDVLDPALAPANHYNQPDGLTPAEVAEAIAQAVVEPMGPIGIDAFVVMA